MPDGYRKSLIYVVDDNDDDRFLLQSIFNDYFDNCELRLFEDGASLLTSLTHRLDGRLPDVILLDMEMPVLNGLDTLRLLAQDETFRLIPTIVLSSSDLQAHIDLCYELGANSFMTKSSHYLQLVKGIGNLLKYWLETAKIPALLRDQTRRQDEMYGLF